MTPSYAGEREIKFAFRTWRILERLNASFTRSPPLPWIVHPWDNTQVIPSRLSSRQSPFNLLTERSIGDRWWYSCLVQASMTSQMQMGPLKRSHDDHDRSSRTVGAPSPKIPISTRRS